MRNHLLDSEKINVILKKICSISPDLSFSILSWSVEDLNQQHDLPHVLLREISGCTHLLGIYMSHQSYHSNRLLNYRSYSGYRNIPSTDKAGRLLMKMKIITDGRSFDFQEEQDFSLLLGILNRTSFKEHYQSKEIDEKHFYQYSNSFTRLNDQQLITLISFKEKQNS